MLSIWCHVQNAAARRAIPARLAGINQASPLPPPSTLSGRRLYIDRCLSPARGGGSWLGRSLSPA